MSDESTVSMLATLAVMLLAALGCSLAALLATRFRALRRAWDLCLRSCSLARGIGVSVGGTLIAAMILAAVLGLVKPEMVLTPGIGSMLFAGLMLSFAMISVGQSAGRVNQAAGEQEPAATLKMPRRAERRAA